MLSSRATCTGSSFDLLFVVRVCKISCEKARKPWYISGMIRRECICHFRFGRCAFDVFNPKEVFVQSRSSNWRKLVKIAHEDNIVSSKILTQFVSVGVFDLVQVVRNITNLSAVHHRKLVKGNIIDVFIFILYKAACCCTCLLPNTMEQFFSW